MAAPPASLRSEPCARPRARVIHNAQCGASSAGGCDLNLSSCICMNGWPFCSAKERPGVLRKAAKWSERKVGRRASFRVGQNAPTPPPAPGYYLSLRTRAFHQIGLYLIVLQIRELRHCWNPDPFSPASSSPSSPPTPNSPIFTKMNTAFPPKFARCASTGSLKPKGLSPERSLDRAQSEVRHVIPYPQRAICSLSFPPGGWQLCPTQSTPPSRKE